MSQNYQVNNSDFYLQWHATGEAGGQWNGSNSSSPDGFSKLESWTLTPHVPTQLNFSVKQGEGNAQTWFVRLHDLVAGSVQGVKIVPGATPRLNLTPSGSLTLLAGIISADPKIQITKVDKPPDPSSLHNALTLLWNGNAWTYQYCNVDDTGKWTPLTDSAPVSDPSGSEMTLQLESYADDVSAPLKVTDMTASPRSPRGCGVYYGSDATGPVLSEAQIRDSKAHELKIGPGPTGLAVGESWKSTVSLFSSTASSTTTLTAG
jgi:hypothetical protein